MEEIFLLKDEPPLAVMAACESMLPREGFEVGSHPIEAKSRNPGADVSEAFESQWESNGEMEGFEKGTKRDSP